jgi:hypothetical protein
MRTQLAAHQAMRYTAVRPSAFVGSARGGWPVAARCAPALAASGKVFHPFVGGSRGRAMGERVWDSWPPLQ